MKGLPQLEAVFITVDPDRDSPEIMKTYLKGMYHVYRAVPYAQFFHETKFFMNFGDFVKIQS